MLKNIFITGTDDQLVSKIGKHDLMKDNNSFYHAVSHHQNSSIHISHFSAFSAPLVCSYAKSHLSKISSICMCLRVPDILSFSDSDTGKSIEKSFHTEWYFTLDLVRQSLLLFSRINSDEPTTKGKLYISLPHLNNYKLNNSELVYYRSLCSALKTMTKHYQTNHKIALVFYNPKDGEQFVAQKLIDFISRTSSKNIRRKVYYLEPLTSYLMIRLKNFFRG